MAQCPFEPTNTLTDPKGPKMYRIKRFFANIRWFFKRWFPKVIAYARFLWNDYDFDYGSIYRLLHFKFERMYRALKNRHAMDSEKRAQQILEASNLAKKLFEDNFAETEYDALTEHWGELEFIDNKEYPGHFKVKCAKVQTEEDEERERQDYLKIMELEAQRRLEAKEALFQLIRDNIEDWWS